MDNDSDFFLGEGEKEPDEERKMFGKSATKKRT